MAGQVGDARCPKLCQWVEDNIEETLTFTRLPRQHHKRLKSTNILERLNQEIKRRIHVVRIFPSAESCLRLVRALAVETHENWLEAMRISTWSAWPSTRRRCCASWSSPRPRLLEDAAPDPPTPATVIANLQKTLDRTPKLHQKIVRAKLWKPIEMEEEGLQAFVQLCQTFRYRWVYLRTVWPSIPIVLASSHDGNRRREVWPSCRNYCRYHRSEGVGLLCVAPNC